MNYRSLRFKLVFPYVLIIILLSITLGGTSYWFAGKNIRQFSDQYIREITARIAQSVSYHISGSAPALEAAFPSTYIASADLGIDLTEIRTRFWIATSMYSNPSNYIYYGNSKGQSIALKRLSNEDVELRVKLNAKDRRNYYHYKGILGTPKQVATEEHNLDPRTRPWYASAINYNNDIWTGVYIDFSSSDLVITRAKRVMGPNRKAVGVVATDISLEKVNNFIRNLNVGSRGRAFLVETDGMLLASNTVPIIKNSDNDQGERVSALASSDNVIASSYSGITKLIDIDNLNKIQRSFYTTIVKEDSNTISVSARHIVDDAGLSWLAIVAIPRDEILTGMRQQLIYGTSIGLIAILITILIGFKIFGGIATDIRSLLEAINSIREGNLKKTITINRKDEVGELAKNFSAMHDEIFTDRLTGLANRAALDSTLKLLTDKPENQPFTLLFLDLNKFKEINDKYGHSNGDLALIEVSMRLKETLREQDFIARLGGDEFVIIVSGVISGANLDHLIDKIKSSVEAPLTQLVRTEGNNHISMGVAIGTAYWPLSSPDPQELVNIADESMYDDKHNTK